MKRIKKCHSRYLKVWKSSTTVLNTLFYLTLFCACVGIASAVGFKSWLMLYICLGIAGVCAIAFICLLCYYKKYLSEVTGKLKHAVSHYLSGVLSPICSNVSCIVEVNKCSVDNVTIYSIPKDRASMACRLLDTVMDELIVLFGKQFEINLKVNN